MQSVTYKQSCKFSWLFHLQVWGLSIKRHNTDHPLALIWELPELTEWANVILAKGQIQLSGSCSSNMHHRQRTWEHMTCIAKMNSYVTFTVFKYCWMKKMCSYECLWIINNKDWRHNVVNGKLLAKSKLANTFFFLEAKVPIAGKQYWLSTANKIHC